jgi:hypothetical protein
LNLFLLNTGNEMYFSYMGVALSVVESGVHRENPASEVIDELLSQWLYPSTPKHEQESNSKL